MNLLIISRKENGMINKDSKQKLDEVVAQALAPGAAQQQDRDSFSMCPL